MYIHVYGNHNDNKKANFFPVLASGCLLKVQIFLAYTIGI